MFIFRKATVLFLFLVFFFVDAVYGQYIPSRERGDVRYRRKAQMEGNQIRTTVFNYGMTGREAGVPITEQTPYEWPKNTGQVYLAVAGIVVGAEVIDNQGETQRIISRMHYLNSPEGKSWNFEPIPDIITNAILKVLPRVMIPKHGLIHGPIREVMTPIRVGPVNGMVISEKTFLMLIRRCFSAHPIICMIDILTIFLIQQI